MWGTGPCRCIGRATASSRKQPVPAARCHPCGTGPGEGAAVVSALTAVGVNMQQPPLAGLPSLAAGRLGLVGGPGHLQASGFKAQGAGYFSTHAEMLHELQHAWGHVQSSS